MRRHLELTKNLPNKIKTFGKSMMPLLHDGDIVYIKKKRFSAIRINDIVCANKNEKTFTHRVIYKTDKYLITKGDNNPVFDGKIYPKNLIGVVYKVKRRDEELNPEVLYLVQSTLYFTEIVKVKRAFEKESVDFVFLKGLPLHLHYEGIHPKRIYEDCDVLIRKNHFKKASLVLKALGYRVFESPLSKRQRALKDKEVELSFYKFTNGIWVSFDLHLEAAFLMTQLGKLDFLYSQKLIDSLSLKLLREKRYININNQRFPILSADNLFIYLVLHLYHHNFQGTFRFDLIKRLAKKEKINYNTISESIRKYRLDNFVYPALILLKKYYELNNITELLEFLKPSKTAQRFAEKDLGSVNIFNDDDRISSGIRRFRNAFVLSPNSYFIKSLIFLDKKVLYSIYLVVSRSIYRNLRLISTK
jgi:signal peptidase I